jgi:FG-GAP repeat
VGRPRLQSSLDAWLRDGSGIGDFNGDGIDDLAIGVPEENIETVPANDAGIVQILYGT